MAGTYKIAIDGPAGAGKSTIARAVAARLGFMYVDTGALYRAMAVCFLRQGIPGDDEARIAAACADMSIGIRYRDGIQRVLLNGEDVTDLIRTEEAGNMASAVSVCAAVRQKLLSLQRDLADENDVVMDGRDIGTCVLPGAQTKIYLTASVQVRALRRCRELEEKGQAPDREKIERDIQERDYRDTHRGIAPLRQAEDAVYLDTSGMTVAQVIERIIRIAGERGLETRDAGSSGSTEGARAGQPVLPPGPG